MRCPTCGSTVDAGSLSCKYCGRNLTNDIRLFERERAAERESQRLAGTSVLRRQDGTGIPEYRETTRKRSNTRRSQEINFGMLALNCLTLLAGIFVLQIIEIIILLIK